MTELKAQIEHLQEKILDLSGEKESETERCLFWETSFREEKEARVYYQQQLLDSHTLLGRTLHQMSECADTLNLGRYFPTDNRSGFRTLNDPSGKLKRQKK